MSQTRFESDRFGACFRHLHVVACRALFLGLLVVGSPATAWTEQCVLATVQPLATDAGLEAYRNGGSAVDAAVAAALTLGVVDSHNSGIGGGCFILIRDPDGHLLAIDGRETAPAAATADMYVREGEPQPDLSKVGPLAVAVPGALAAYDLAIEKVGRLSLAELLDPAAALADEGFAIDRIYASNLQSKAAVLSQFPGSRSALLKADGQPYREGEILRQPDLAKTYRNVAEHGIDWFYRGPFAKVVGQWMKQNGGIVSAADFAEYRPLVREPVRTTYRGYQVVGFPPPSSGGIHVGQILNMLESFDLPVLHREEPAHATNVIIEAMKLAFADRAHWLGDADFANVPQGLIEQDYARLLAKRIRADQSTPVASHGDPLPFHSGWFGNGKHTTHIAAADSEGYWVAITATVNTHYGSKVIVPGTGVILNNEMDDFSIQPGVPNAFGLIGAANNAIAPGKRPLSSMSPTIVLRPDGTPRMTVGAAGGPKIITQAVLAIVRHLDYGCSLQEAVAAPRFHHQWRPDSVLVERSLDQRLVHKLREMGHDIEVTDHSGVTQAISMNDRGELIGVHDPRIPGEVGSVTRTALKHLEH